MCKKESMRENRRRDEDRGRAEAPDIIGLLGGVTNKSIAKH